MNKSEIKKAENHALISDLVNSYSRLLLNYNFNKATKQLEKHCADLEKELLDRGLLTQEEIKILNQ